MFQEASRQGHTPDDVSIFSYKLLSFILSRENRAFNPLREKGYYLTLIFIVAFLLLPSVAIAVTLTVLLLADFFALTTPLLFTVAYLVLLDFQSNFLFAFLEAVILAFSFNVLPALTVFRPDIRTFLTIPFMEVIFQEADILLPSVVVAVILTFLPPEFLFNFTTPAELTVATFLLLDLQVSF